MKGLIVRKPWIDLILSGEKTLEMRSSRTHFRGDFALIESGSGLIKGISTLVGCVDLKESDFLKTQKQHCVEDLSLLNRWHYGWELLDSKPLPAPIHYNHPKGAVIWVDLSSNEGLNEYLSNL